MIHNITTFWLPYRFRLILQCLEPEPIGSAIPSDVSLALLRIQLIIPPTIPGNALAALIPNRPNSDAKALSLFLIHSFEEPDEEPNWTNYLERIHVVPMKGKKDFGSASKPVSDSSSSSTAPFSDVFTTFLAMQFED